MKKKNNTWLYSLILMGFVMGLTISCKKKEMHVGEESTKTITRGPDVTDIEGTLYHSVVIGNQIWMSENLETTKYANGNDIPNVTSDSIWNNLSTGAYCDYNDTPRNSSTYGRLYNWYAATDTGKICPTGWHLPSNGEWNILERYLDHTVDTGIGAASRPLGRNIGSKLKEKGTIHWSHANTGAKNFWGFSALPGGCRNFTWHFQYLIYIGYWWTSTESSSTKALAHYLYWYDPNVFRSPQEKGFGFSIRCVKN